MLLPLYHKLIYGVCKTFLRLILDEYKKQEEKNRPWW